MHLLIIVGFDYRLTFNPSTFTCTDTDDCGFCPSKPMRRDVRERGPNQAPCAPSRVSRGIERALVRVGGR